MMAMDSAQTGQPSEDFVRRAVALFGEQHLEQAARICRLGLLAEPRRLEGRLVLGRALMALGKPEDVLAEMRAVLEQEPDSHQALLLKAEALVRLRSYSRARQALRQVDDLDPLNEQASQLLEYLQQAADDDEAPASLVSTDTRQYPSPRAKEIAVTGETGLFLEQTSEEALKQLSTVGDQGQGGALAAQFE